MLSKVKSYFNRRKYAFAKVADSNEGKLLLGEIYKFCETKDPIVPNDPLSTGKNIGKELVAKHIKKILHQDDRVIEEILTAYKQERSK